MSHQSKALVVVEAFRTGAVVGGNRFPKFGGSGADPVSDSLRLKLCLPLVNSDWLCLLQLLQMRRRLF